MDHDELMRSTLAARGCAENTVRTYLGCLRRFEAHVAKPLEVVELEDLVAYQRHLANARLDYSTFNQSFCALRFFYRDCLQRPWDYQRIPFQKKPRKLPEVLSQGEVSSLFDACANLKHRTILMTGYGCGLRVSETLALKPEHIDSKRMVVRVEQGKGRKDRYVMLPERLLAALREYWRACRPRVWMFEGEQPGRQLSRQTVHLVFRAACQKAGITKRVSFHSLRHSFATHLLENGVNVRVIQVLLGHRSLGATQVYTHVARTFLDQTRSPLDVMAQPNRPESIPSVM